MPKDQSVSPGERNQGRPWSKASLKLIEPPRTPKCIPCPHYFPPVQENMLLRLSFRLQCILRHAFREKRLPQMPINAFRFP